MKKILYIAGLILGSMLLTACSTSDEKEQYVLYAGHSLAADHPFELAMQELKERVEERTDGRVIIETFPLSQLGAERELIEGAMLGSVDLVVSTSGPIMNFVKDFAVLDLPFLFNDRDAAVNILEGDIGEDLFAQLREIGIVGLSWGENGFRHVTNSIKPVATPEDLEGLSLRVQENKVFISAFNELGVTPSPMAWTEALTALQSGVVDGQENPILVIDSYKLYDANQKYMTLTSHAYSSAVFMMSEHAYNRLPEDLRDIVMEEGEKIGAYERQLVVDMEEQALQRLKENGMEVVEEVDTGAFRDKIMKVYDSSENQQLLQRILSEQ
ncbi:Extracytoplasmic solute receptor protein yiaO [Solibacillus isronensis B3W22]|uniref:Extracytoplasmic solute receptor protein yiaO n=1 Tax=Solibacillus isronensis B3W22 TaxID=1224748 RepID=K1LJ48_9BACL|nr:TRAP transporter substrate-binding protein [Solibacillus isronensis]AMO85543.1 C4-dicarboxylate ABC transporter substrate-binding protein [Solibacillus silvestris]EKB44439.1 Extracytoplasmic solute receptor protein yiaO [Solibacillus isronensis B3W22]